MKFALVVLSLMLVVQAQHEERCDAPVYFQARFFEYDHVTNYFRRGEMSYDAVEQRVRYLESRTDNATRPQYDVIIRHDLKKEYRIDLKTRHCNISDLTHSFHPIATPENAHFLGDSSIGMPERVGEGVIVASWDYRVEDTDFTGDASMTLTRFDCVPVQYRFVGHNSKTKQNYRLHRSYFDVTLGLNDPNIFDVPMECRK